MIKLMRGAGILLATIFLGLIIWFVTHCQECHRLRGNHRLLGYEVYARDIDESEWSVISNLTKTNKFCYYLRLMC